MDSWPNEIKIHVFQFCDFRTLLSLRQTSVSNHLCVEDVLKKQKSFDFREYYDKETMVDFKFNLSKMVTFFDHFKNLQELTLANVPTLITLADMIKLTRPIIKIKSLTIIQSDTDFIGTDVFLALNYFDCLQHLKIVDWEPKSIVGRGCAARYDSIPFKSLQSLKTLHIVCNKDTISKTLWTIVTRGTVLSQIVSVSFKVRYPGQDIPNLIMQFIDMHPHLKSISINGLLFTTQNQVESFYQRILTSPCLEKLDLHNCHAIDRIELTIQRKFIDSLKKKGIFIENAVNSMRHI